MIDPTDAQTFVSQWERSVASRPDEVFLRFEASDGSVTSWTYGEFDELVLRVASRLRAAGADADRGVHLALTNSPAFVAVWLAAARLGSWIVPSDPMATAPELAEHIGRTRVAASVVSTDRVAAARHACAEVEHAPELLAVHEDDPVLDALTGDPLDPSDLGRPAPTDRLAIMFTSGTTGRPKGVVITQANYAFAGTTMAAAAQLEPEHRQLVVLPLFHANAQYYSFASAIAVGASVALMHTFSASGFLRQAVEHDATHASLFAGPMRMILARAEPDPDRPLRLRHCWFAQNIAADQYATLSEWFGCSPRQLYGMTETIPAVLTDDAVDPRPDSMGRVTSGCVLELQDDTGGPVPAGEEGEVVVGGTPGLTLFAEYLDDPETTAASYRGAWFRTGDRARIGDDGRFEFGGRNKDILKVSGENVSVAEVESVLDAHPDVFDVVVVGAPDPIRDEVPVAVVVPADRAVLEQDAHREAVEAALAIWCEQRLGKAKRPRHYTFVADMPRTSVGKIRKFMLTETAAQAVEARSEEPSR